MRAQSWSYNGFFGSSRDIELEPGVLNEAARDVFTRGHCHSLALALTELLHDAELVAVWDGEAEPAHILVRLSDGGLLDANGLTYDEEDITEGYEAFGIDVFLDDIDEEHLEWLSERGTYRPPRAVDALPFARALIAREAISELALAV